jgi:hypothetical protein
MNIVVPVLPNWGLRDVLPLTRRMIDQHPSLVLKDQLLRMSMPIGGGARLVKGVEARED